MSRTLNDTQTMLLDAAIGILDEQAPSYDRVEPPAEPRTVDRKHWQQLAELGWHGLALPETLGGAGLGIEEAAILTEQIGRRAAPLPFVTAAVIPTTLLSACPDSSETVAEVARLLATGERLVTLAWQERSHSDIASAPGTRLADNRLVGSKRFVQAVADDGILLVTASTGDGLALVAVAADGPGVQLERFATGDVAAANVSFKEAPLLGGAPLATGANAEQALARALVAGRVALAAQLAGNATGCLGKTLQHLRDRHQFGKPLAAFQALRHRAVDLYIGTQLADASWRHAASCMATEPDASATLLAIAAAKARCGEVALQTAKEAVQMHGAMGFTEEGGIGRYLRAALHGNSLLGAPRQLRRQLLET